MCIKFGYMAADNLTFYNKTFSSCALCRFCTKAAKIQGIGIKIKIIFTPDAQYEIYRVNGLVVEASAILGNSHSVSE
jgi:hypothetical protein